MSKHGVTVFISLMALAFGYWLCFSGIQYKIVLGVLLIIVSILKILGVIKKA